MRKAQSLTEYARAGYNGNDNPHLWSSPCWYAHIFGRYMHDSGRSIPDDVRMGRGDSIRCGDMRFTFKHESATERFSDETRVVFTREQ